MRKIYKNIITAKFYLVVGVFILGTHFLSGSIYAQQKLDLTISPPVAYLKVAPGTTQTHIISIKNTSENPTTVTPQIVDFAINSENGNPYLLEEHTFPYFTMPDAALKPITIEPDQVAQLQLRIEAPATAPEKEYPLSILFVSNTEENATTTDATKVSGAVASNLIVLVSDKNQLEKKLVVEDFGAPRVIDSFRGATINPVLKNERFSTSNASGSAKLTSWSGRTVAEYEIYPDNILGFSTRPIRALSANSETPQVTAFTFNSAFMIGPYQLTLELDNDGTTDTFTYTIFAIPFSIIIAAIMGILVGAIYWYKIRTTNMIKI